MYGAICLLAPLQSHCGFVGFLIATRLWLVDVKMIYRPWDCELSQVHCNCLRCYELILEQFLCYQSCMLSWIAWFGDQVSSGKKIIWDRVAKHSNMAISVCHVLMCTYALLMKIARCSKLTVAWPWWIDDDKDAFCFLLIWNQSIFNGERYAPIPLPGTKSSGVVKSSEIILL